MQSESASALLLRICRCVPVTLPLLLFSFSSATDDVDHRKNHHPDPVDKMPIERKDPELFRMLTRNLSGQRKDEHDRKHGQADNYVTCVQADQRVERGAKEVGADGQSIV